MRRKVQGAQQGFTILGINQTLPKVEVETFDYDTDFTLLCYTDGLTDIANSKGELFSVEMMKEIMLQQRYAGPDSLNEAILNYAEEFKGENDFPDDIALMTIKVEDKH